MAETDCSGSSEAATWMRNAHVAVYAFMSVCALSGLCYMFHSAFAGQVFPAVAGALVAIGGVTLGCLALVAVRFGAVLVARTERIEHLVTRVEALESALEVQGVTVDLLQTGAGDPEKLVAANVPDDGFPRLARPEPANPPAQPTTVSSDDAGRCSREEHQWQVAYQSGDIATCRRVLHHLRQLLKPERITSLEEGLRAMSRTKAVQLREDFASRVRSRNYAAALTTGEQIAELFPGSALACEFKTLRPRLLERVEQRKGTQPASAV